MPGTLTATTIGSRPLALCLHGIANIVRDGTVVHAMHDGAAFVIGTDSARVLAVAEHIGDKQPTFRVELADSQTNSLVNTRGYEAYAPVLDMLGRELAWMRVHNSKPPKLPTERGKMQLNITLAENLTAGDVFCDGTAGRGGWVVYTASNSTAGQYLPGRMVFKR